MIKNYSAALPSEWKEISRIFIALGDEHRQRMLLLFEPGERLNVGQIAEVSTLARSTVSHHLKVLHESGVLASEKVGKGLVGPVGGAIGCWIVAAVPVVGLKGGFRDVLPVTGVKGCLEAAVPVD